MKSAKTIKKLYEANEKLVYIVLNDVYKGPAWQKLPEDRKNDLVQAAKLGLIEGLHKWNPKKGKLGPTVRHYLFRAITAELDNASAKAVSITQHGRARARKELDEEPESHTSVVLREHLTDYPDQIDECFDAESENLNPEELLIRAEEEREEDEMMDGVNRQLQSLEPEESLIVKEVMKGRSYREIGFKLNKKSSEVELTYKRAIMLLRQMNGVNEDE